MWVITSPREDLYVVGRALLTAIYDSADVLSRTRVRANRTARSAILPRFPYLGTTKFLVPDRIVRSFGPLEGLYRHF
jgi:hypothetical protein